MNWSSKLGNGHRIQPYMSGEEIDESPTHSPKRWVINFGDMTLDEARRWPDLLNRREEGSEWAAADEQGRG